MFFPSGERAKDARLARGERKMRERDHSGCELAREGQWGREDFENFRRYGYRVS